MVPKIFFIGVALIQTGCSLFGIQNEEGPKYTTVRKEQNKEIRVYESHLIATTWVEGSFKESQGAAFRILANYIFGDNRSKEKIAMTAPVLQTPDEQDLSEKIPMTAPVTQKPDRNGWKMSFVLPSKYQIEDLPVPNDDRVEIEQVPEKMIAAIRYSGLWREKTNQANAKELQVWIDSLGSYRAISQPIFAGYNPPWTLPFLRRNEMLIELEPVK